MSGLKDFLISEPLKDRRLFVFNIIKENPGCGLKLILQKMREALGDQIEMNQVSGRVSELIKASLVIAKEVVIEEGPNGLRRKKGEKSANGKVTRMLFVKQENYHAGWATYAALVKNEKKAKSLSKYDQALKDAHDLLLELAYIKQEARQLARKRLINAIDETLASQDVSSLKIVIKSLIDQMRRANAEEYKSIIQRFAA